MRVKSLGHWLRSFLWASGTAAPRAEPEDELPEPPRSEGAPALALSLLLDSLTEPLALYKHGCQLIAVNEPFLLWAGCSREELLQSSDPLSFLESGEMEQLYQFLDAYRYGQGRNSGSITLAPKHKSGGDSSAALQAYAVEGPNGTIDLALVVRDRSADNRSELDLLRRKLEEQYALISRTVHSMKNLMTSIVGSVSLVQRRTESLSPARQAAILDLVLRSACQIIELNENLLQIARGARDSKSCHPIKAAESVMAALRVVEGCEEARGFVFDVDVPDDTIVYADENGLSQVIVNLIANAIDAMVEPGVIALSLEALGPRANAEVAIEIRDSGRGLSAELQSRIFLPFFTTKDKSGRPQKGFLGGSGLGLASVAALVESWGGRVLFSSEEGQGTTVRVYLRRAESPSAVASAEM